METTCCHWTSSGEPWDSSEADDTCEWLTCTSHTRKCACRYNVWCFISLNRLLISCHTYVRYMYIPVVPVATCIGRHVQVMYLALVSDVRVLRLVIASLASVAWVSRESLQAAHRFLSLDNYMYMLGLQRYQKTGSGSATHFGSVTRNTGHEFFAPKKSKMPRYFLHKSHYFFICAWKFE